MEGPEANSFFFQAIPVHLGLPHAVSVTAVTTGAVRETDPFKGFSSPNSPPPPMVSACILQHHGYMHHLGLSGIVLVMEINQI